MMNKKTLYWICQIGGWSLYALVNILSLKINGALTQTALITFILHAVFLLLSTHAFRWFIIKRGWLRLVINQLIPRLLVAVIFLGVINFLFQLSVSYVFSSDFKENISLSMVIINLATMPLLYFLWSSGYFTYHYIESYNRSLKYEAAMTEIELNHLKSQLNPHFMFNALNSIRALVDENPPKAKRAINQLSSILRSSLVTDKMQLTEFSNELRTVKNYLDLEGVRYEERLKTSIEYDQEAFGFRVPPLMLQTLVENGIKHGIARLKDGGQVSIQAEVIDEKLQVIIKNSGQYLNGKSKGLGLINTRKRLELIYGDRAFFEIRNEGSNTVITELHIPKTA